MRCRQRVKMDHEYQFNSDRKGFFIVGFFEFLTKTFLTIKK
jgi:hypothetical protein